MTRTMSTFFAASALLAGAPAAAQTTPQADPPTQQLATAEDSVALSAPSPVAQGSAPEEDASALSVGFAVRTIDDLSQSRVRSVLATTPPDEAQPTDPATPPS